jgi:hypothetical protein
MAYIINLTDGAIFATIPDGTINTNSSMTLIGRNYAGYGEFLDENFIHLLENGSNSTAPAAPLIGQLWWDKTNGLLKVYNGTGFKTLSSSTASNNAPSNNVIGDLWYDTSNQQLKVWNGTSWLLVGPSFTAGTGTTGAVVDTIVDNTLVSHPVIKLYVSDSIVGIISKDAAFTPQSAIPGFTQVLPGITLATLVGSQVPLFQGTATNSQSLGGFSYTSFMRTDANTSTTGTLSVLSDNGLTVGSDSDFKVSVSGINVNVQNQTDGGTLIFKVNSGGSPTTVATLSSSGLALTSALTAANGGTGLTSPGLTGNVLVSNGTAWISTAQTANLITLVDGANIAWNMNLGLVANVTIAGNRNMDNPTNLKLGTMILKVTQGGSGSYDLTWGTAFKWPSGVKPLLSTGVGNTDVISFFCDGTTLYGSYIRDVQ